ncbi:MAG TPA: histidine kinase [Fulvivirga sp.]|nr:histidine kinase [Fulvivirga sp.]
MRKIKSTEWILHALLVAIGLILLNYQKFDLTFGVFRSGDQSLLWPSIFGTVINLILFYGIAFYLIPVILRKKGVASFILWLITFFIVFSGIELLIDYNFFVASGKIFTPSVRSEMIIMITVIHVLSVIFGIAYRFSKDWFNNEETRRNISEQQLRSELEVLKGQINPHFLFNALNSLFSMSLHSGDEKTAEGISKLAEMMRYVFDRSGEDKVFLKEEIQYIQDYIHLQQLRFEKQVEVRLQYDEFYVPFSIAPMLLIPFVENAFKYGVSSQEKTKIDIQMGIENKTFNFEISNKVIEHKETISSSGVGIMNVRKRLSLIYPEKHTLEISDQNGIYRVNLSITN